MTAPARPLSLRILYGETLSLVWRDLPLILALWLPLCAAGLLGAVWIEGLVRGVGPARPTAEVIPWLIDIAPSFPADAAVVWVALRRLRGGQGPALGGWLGVASTLGAVVAIDLVENVTDLMQALVPSSVSGPMQPFYGLGALILTAFWTALWLPAVAVTVDQRQGGPASLGRALGLVAGHLSALATFSLSIYVVTRLVTYAAAYGFSAAGLGGTPGWVVELIVLPIGAFGSVSQAVVYWELTRLKTGATPSPGVAEVSG